MSKLILRENPAASFTNAWGDTVRVFDVYNPAGWYGLRHHEAQVWCSTGPIGPGNTRCTACEGQLVSMRSDCRHARAVARFIKREEARYGEAGA